MNQIINKFNEISIDFLNQTAPLTGYSYLYKFKMLTQFNSIYAIDAFIQNVLPYKHKIITRNESFFLNKSIETSYIDDIIGIKQIYHKLDKQSKNNIWDIIIALIYLAEERFIYMNKLKTY